MTVESEFLRFATDELRQLVGRIEVCLNMLTDAQIWQRSQSTNNAIGNLVLHLNGNVRQWIIASLGGETSTRNRDAEFAATGGPPAAELIATLRETIDRATQIIANLTTDQLTQTYNIQVYQASGVNAVFHVVEHFSMHTGQIIFATKLLTGEDLGFYRHLNPPSPDHG